MATERFLILAPPGGGVPTGPVGETGPPGAWWVTSAEELGVALREGHWELAVCLGTVADLEGGTLEALVREVTDEVPALVLTPADPGESAAALAAAAVRLGAGFLPRGALDAFLELSLDGSTGEKPASAEANHQINNLLSRVMGSVEIVQVSLGAGHPAQADLNEALEAVLKLRARLVVTTPPGHGSPDLPRPRKLPGRTEEAGGERVMLVDDDAEVAEAAVKILRSGGFAVEAYNDAAEALEVFGVSPGRFEVVVTDLVMPSMSGIALAEKLWELRPDLPVLLTSGYTESIDAPLAREIGFADFIFKPYDSRSLGAAVKRAATARATGDPP